MKPSHSLSSPRLAILGGSPIRTGGWPSWPTAPSQALEALATVCRRPRWALSGPYSGEPSFGAIFAHSFARFNEVPYCLATASGTASLSIALEALDVGPGDEVLVPGITWVACPSVVANLNATPILVDINPDTLCMNPSAAEAAITSRTKAIMIVHLYSAVGDMKQVSDLAQRHGLAVIEDCAQAHGARWENKRVGTIGNIGTFSMQNGKVLTAGEGGATVTSDNALYETMQSLHCDGRLISSIAPVVNQMELVETKGRPGNNWCLSEFQAAMLVEQLRMLQDQNDARARSANVLNGWLSAQGWRPQSTSPGTTSRTYYQYVVGFNAEELGVTAQTVAEALSAELGIRVSTPYAPLNCHPLYQPLCRRRWLYSKDRVAELDTSRFDLIESARAHRSFVVFPHQYLLGTDEDLSDIAAAFAKVHSNITQLRTVNQQ